MRLLKKIALVALILVGWFGSIFVRLLKDASFISTEVYNLLYTGAYTLFGFVFILFCFLIVRDVIWYAIYGTSRLMGKDVWALNPKNLSVLGHANRIIIALSVVVSLYALYQGNKIPEINEFTLQSPKLIRDMRIAHLSDLHLNRSVSVKRINRLVEAVNNQAVDLILITGDIIDDDATKMEAQLEALQQLSAPYGVYVSLGNHEYYSGLSSVSYRFRKMGFPLLMNRGTHINGSNIFVAGVPDAFTAAVHETFNINLQQATQGSELSDYRILMAHTPDIAAQLSPATVDLVLSGHTHGGQIFPFHYFVWKANKFLSGLYDVNGLKLHVSSGAGTWGPAMRLFAPSDITIINLIGK